MICFVIILKKRKITRSLLFHLLLFCFTLLGFGLSEIRVREKREQYGHYKAEVTENPKQVKLTKRAKNKTILTQKLKNKKRKEEEEREKVMGVRERKQERERVEEKGAYTLLRFL